MATLGQLITIEMERRGLTNRQLAQEVGVSESHISSWRSDAKRASVGFPNLSSMRNLAKALNVPVQTIIEAFAETLGYPMSQETPLAAKLVASTKGVDDLTPAQIADLANMVAAFAALNAAKRAAKDTPND